MLDRDHMKTFLNGIQWWADQAFGEALIAGGCVRDTLLGLDSFRDIDIFVPVERLRSGLSLLETEMGFKFLKNRESYPHDDIEGVYDLIYAGHKVQVVGSKVSLSTKDYTFPDIVRKFDFTANQCYFFICDGVPRFNWLLTGEQDRERKILRVPTGGVVKDLAALLRRARRLLDHVGLDWKVLVPPGAVVDGAPIVAEIFLSWSGFRNSWVPVVR